MIKVIVAAVCGLTIACSAAPALAAPLIVGHRGASTATVAEETLPAYQYATANRADILEGDVRWTKKSVPSPNGVMMMWHDPTLDRVSNCVGYVAARYWSDISTNCRTDVGGSRPIRFAELVSYANSVGKPLVIEIKVASITDAQARQFYNVIKANPGARVDAFPAALASLNKVKRLDAADSTHRLAYSLIVSGSGGWPSAATIKAVGSTADLSLEAPADVVAAYKAAGIRVILWTGRTTTDYQRMSALNPYGVIVDDVRKYRAWLATR